MMSQLTLYEISVHKPNRRFHVSYHSAESAISGIKNIESLLKQNWIKLGHTHSAEFDIPSFDKPTKVIESIVTMSYDGFELDLNKMKTGRHYRITYDDSVYEVVKNEKGELEISEVE